MTVRLFTAMITPYDNDLQVNYQKAEELAEHLVNNGSDGIIVCGTTGESPVLSTEEKLKLFSVVKNKVGDRVEVWAGTGSNSTAATIELSKEAEKLGVSGLLLVTPYYNKPTQEGLFLHFKSIAESVSIPVMLYNVPSRTGISLLPETILSLSEINNIKAIKEASGNLDQISLLRTTLPEDFLIYSGDDSLTLPMLAVGAAGVVSIASHIVGNNIKEMIDSFFAGKINKAMEIHQYLFPIFRGLFICSNPIPLKESLNLMGMDVGGLRLPLCSAGEKERAELKALLKRINLI